MSANSQLTFQGISLDIKAIAFDMAEGCLTEIKEIFFLEGKYPPIVRWCSYAQSDWPKPHQILSQYWRNNFYVDQFSLENLQNNPDLKLIMPYLVHLKQIDNGDNYAYNFIGDRAAYFMGLPQNYKEDLLGILKKSQKAQDLFNVTCVAACGVRGQGMLVLSQDGTEKKPVLWNKMIVPLLDRSGKAVEFLMCVLRMPPQ